jgi:nicotinamidase-related amidase
MHNRHPNVLRPECALLILVDLQEPFLRGVVAADRVLDRSAFLARAASILDIPVIASLQYPQRMGGAVDTISASLPASTRSIEKMTFSCACDNVFVQAVRDSGRTQLLLAGVETHICVAQTALDLLHHGYQLHVAADAVSSRGMDRHKLGMEKMRDAGVIPCSAEQAVFEWLQEAGTESFKQVLKLVKD